MSLRAPALCGLIATVAWAEVKPAAIQVCLELPEGEALFESHSAPATRSLGTDTWILDLDVTFDGVAPERLTRARGSCFRAWLQPRKVRQVELSFGRVPRNLLAVTRAVNFDLKSDLFYDAGSVAVERQPFSSIDVKVPGTLTLERQTPTGLVRESPARLPIGQYRLSFAPSVPSAPCETRLEVLAVGSVTAERQPSLLAELTAHYEKTFLPEVLKRSSTSCARDEIAVVQTRLVDGVFARPWEPVVTKRRLPERAAHYELRQGTKRHLLLEGEALISIGAGEHFELVAKAEGPGHPLAAGPP